MANALQLLRRLEEADDNGYVSCVTCGVTRLYNDGIQGGHFITRSCLGLIINEINVHPQCHHCNAPTAKGGLNGNYINYTMFMINKYGKEKVDWLISQKSKPCKMYTHEIEWIHQDFKKRIKAEKKRIAI